MIKYNKLTLFILMFITATGAGFSFYLVDWESVKTGERVFSELQLPFIFLILSFFFMVPYVKRIKEDKKKEN